MIVFFFIRPSGFFWFLAQFEAGCGTLLVSAAQQPLLPGTPQATGRSVGAGAGPPRGDKSDGQEAPAHRPSEPYPAEKARGGRIILKTPLQRGVFIAGLVGAVILVLVLALVR